VVDSSRRAGKRGDIDLLEKIAKDPEAFILQQGWASVSLDDLEGAQKVRALYEHLQVRILTLIEVIDALKQSPDYELYMCEKEKAGTIDEVIGDQKQALEEELVNLRTEAEKKAEKKAKEIEELTGNAPGDMLVY
jgi:hypothetical protein